MRRSRVLLAGVVASAALLVIGCVPPPPDGGPNLGPVAVASHSVPAVVTPLTVQFSSTGSNDPDGSIASYSWNFGDGNSSTDPNPLHAYGAPGTYTVLLTVTDNKGSTGTASISVTVSNDTNGRYVATTGADSGDCATSQAPCLTVNYAADQALAGDTVYVAPGSYPEIVTPDKALTFKGNNTGISAGADAGSRRPESTVRGFRSGLAAVNYQDFVLDGFEIDPTSDPSLLTNAVALVNVVGGDTTSIVNNLFTGAQTFFRNCSHTCTDMGDYAVHVRSGNIDISHNGFVNWRRPVNVVMGATTPAIQSISISKNDFLGVTSRAMSVGAATGIQDMPGAVVDGNVVDVNQSGTASSPAGITITNHSNQVTNNTFRGLASGVYILLCKKYSQNDNVVTGNTFNANGAGVNVTTALDSSDCSSPMTEGSGAWVAGGGRADGLKINDNNFVDNSAFAIRLNPSWGSYTPAYTTGLLDATCNWYGDAAGPSGGNSVINAVAPNSSFDVVPFKTSPTGPCNGGL